MTLSRSLPVYHPILRLSIWIDTRISWVTWLPFFFCPAQPHTKDGGEKKLDRPGHADPSQEIVPFFTVPLVCVDVTRGYLGCGGDEVYHGRGR